MVLPPAAMDDPGTVLRTRIRGGWTRGTARDSLGSAEARNAGLRVHSDPGRPGVQDATCLRSEPFFVHGFAVDGLEEPLVTPSDRQKPGTPDYVFTQIPGVLVCRMRRVSDLNRSSYTDSRWMDSRNRS